MRLIDADALAMHMADWQLSACSDQYSTIEEAIDAVAGAPTIDAVPATIEAHLVICIRLDGCKSMTES